MRGGTGAGLGRRKKKRVNERKKMKREKAIGPKDNAIMARYGGVAGGR